MDSDRLLGRVALLALGLALLASLTAAAPPPKRQALDCNSDLEIILPMTVAAGSTEQVQLTVTSGPSTDAANNPVRQLFKTITFFPSCTSTLPCMVDAALPVTFVGPVSTTCSVDDPWTATPMGAPVGSEIEFSFTGGTGPSDPAALTLPPAGSPTGTTQCDLFFDVLIDPGFTGTISMEAGTQGVCEPTGVALDSTADATANLTVVPTSPTMGETALIVLALLLAFGSWAVLRRRPVGGQAG